MVRLHLIVSGRVQGVGFRFYTRGQADELGINGWVRNKANGSVEIDAEGDRMAMKQFLNAVESGSPFSQVENISYDEKENLENYQSFKVIG